MASQQHSCNDPFGHKATAGESYSWNEMQLLVSAHNGLVNSSHYSFHCWKFADTVGGWSAIKCICVNACEGKFNHHKHLVANELENTYLIATVIEYVKADNQECRSIVS